MRAEDGAFDISVVSDLPVFIDPFLLFNSETSEYVAGEASDVPCELTVWA